MRLSGLRCMIGYDLYTSMVLGVGLSSTQASPGFDRLHFNEAKKYIKDNGDPGLCLRLALWVV
jgi:hypothetical protein